MLILIIAVIIAIIVIMTTNNPNPLTSKIEQAARSHVLLFIIYIILLLATAVLPIFVWSSQNKYQDLIKLEADAKIEEAKSEAEKARLKGNEIEQENLKLKEEVAKAQLALLQFKEQLKPRHLTDAQQTRLISLLQQAPKGKIIIESIASNSDSANFANQITAVLKLIGWDTRTMSTMSFGGNVPIGMFLIVRDVKSAPARAGALQRAFLDVGFTMLAESDKNFPQDDVKIFVGAKP
jgi:predicted PurR-regulated permease PerM